MRSKSQAIKIVTDTWTTITGNKQPENIPHIILNRSDKAPTPYVEKEILGDKVSIPKIFFPLYYWREAPEKILRATVLCEMVNFFLNENTSIETAMRKEITDVKNQYADQPTILAEQINLTYLRYENMHITDVQTARKLEGDEGIYKWLIDAKYSPNWLIDFLKFLIIETQKRIKTQALLQAKIAGLEKRIDHFKLLINEDIEKAKELRDNQDSLAQKAHNAFALTTV